MASEEGYFQILGKCKYYKQLEKRKSKGEKGAAKKDRPFLLDCFIISLIRQLLTGPLICADLIVGSGHRLYKINPVFVFMELTSSRRKHERHHDNPESLLQTHSLCS